MITPPLNLHSQNDKVHFVGPRYLSKFGGRKAKSNHLGDSNESPMKRTAVITVIMFSGNEPLKRSPIVQIEIVPSITE